MGNSFIVEPEAGIGPATYALRVRCDSPVTSILRFMVSVKSLTLKIHSRNPN